MLDRNDDFGTATLKFLNCEVRDPQVPENADDVNRVPETSSSDTRSGEYVHNHAVDVELTILPGKPTVTDNKPLSSSNLEATDIMKSSWNRVDKAQGQAGKRGRSNGDSDHRIPSTFRAKKKTGGDRTLEEPQPSTSRLPATNDPNLTGETVEREQSIQEDVEEGTSPETHQVTGDSAH